MKSNKEILEENSCLIGDVEQEIIDEEGLDLEAYHEKCLNEARQAEKEKLVDEIDYFFSYMSDRVDVFDYDGAQSDAFPKKEVMSFIQELRYK